jgi:hypothetical protein
MKISKETIFELCNEFSWCFDNKTLDLGNDILGNNFDRITHSKYFTKESIDKYYDYLCKNADVICIISDKDWASNNEGNYYGMRFDIPKSKEVTIEWIHDRMSKKLGARYAGRDNYEMFNEMVKKYKLPAYATTFGFSLCVSIMDRSKDIQKVSDTLKELGIEFNTRVSFGGWNYNWVVSQKRDNMQIVKGLVKESNDIKHLREYFL